MYSTETEQRSPEGNRRCGASAEWACTLCRAARRKNLRSRIKAKNGKLYYVDDNGNRVQPNQTYNPFEKLQRKAQANLENVKSFINNSDTNSQNYKDKINLALGLITAPMGGSSLLASKGATALTPLVGKNIGKAISSSAIGGATGSGVAGFGRGLVEDKNPLLTMVSDGTLGFLFGGAFGLAGGKIGKKLAEKNLQNNNIAPQKYFDDYVVGLNLNLIFLPFFF